jgi:hypothetical protein
VEVPPLHDLCFEARFGKMPDLIIGVIGAIIGSVGTYSIARFNRRNQLSDDRSRAYAAWFSMHQASFVERSSLGGVMGACPLLYKAQLVGSSLIPDCAP